MNSPARGERGHVDLVGAGPGDPGLITVAGMQCLARADLVIYDALVNPELLRHSRRDAELFSLGRHGRERLVSQAEVHERMIAAARLGRRVVRLKGGDPGVFARIAEEADALRAAGISYAIVPGVTVALAAGSYAGIPLTHRDCASAVALVTGQQGADTEGASLDYARLAQFPGTLVFYMGVTSAPRWASELVAGGRSPQTPVAIVRYCSWPRQQVWETTLAELPALLRATRIRPPVVAIVGEVVALRENPTWFESRPLFGARILVTRPAHQAGALADKLSELGAEVLLQPAIEIGPPDDPAPFEAVLHALDSYDWIVFSSANGVSAVMDRLWQTGRDGRALGRARIAVIGPGTAAELERHRLLADVQPAEFHAEALAETFVKQAQGRRFLLIRASRGREVLAEQLAAAGAQVDQVVAYTSRDVVAPDAEIAAQLAAGAIDWVTVTSSAIARSLAQMFGEGLCRARLASISPLTTATLGELGYPVEAEAAEATMDALCAAMAAASQRG
ncbi:MAG: uroporphyrinogen-III C-methyltransferase [Pirellulales bacterium]|nr:uroporphyrinogen-III C-methyltransferase [Pirellulales bacterium]